MYCTRGRTLAPRLNAHVAGTHQLGRVATIGRRGSPAYVSPRLRLYTEAGTRWQVCTPRESIERPCALAHLPGLGQGFSTYFQGNCSTQHHQRRFLAASFTRPVHTLYEPSHSE